MAKVKQQKKDTPQPAAKSETGFSISGQNIYAYIVFAFAFLLYFNSVFNDYNLDDELVTENQHLTSQGITAIPEIFNSPYYSDKAGYKYEYRPVVLASFAIEHSIFGDNAHISHFINVLLYALACMLLFIVLRRIFGKYNVLFPFMVAMLFAAHPIHTEVVASIKNRDEILALLFGLLSLQCALIYVEQKSAWWLLLVPVLFFIGILSKPTMITFALIIPLALIMFSGASFITVMLITSLLAIPATLYSRLNFISAQIGFVIALLLSACFFYALQSFSGLADVKDSAGNFYAGLKSRWQQISEADLQQLKQPRLGFPVFSIIAVLLITGIYGLYVNNMWALSAAAALLGLLFFATGNEIRLVLITPVSLLAIVVMSKFEGGATIIEPALICFLVSQAIGTDKRTRIVAGSNYLVYALIAIIFFHSYFLPFSFLFYAGIFNRKLLPVSLVVVIISLLAHGYSIYTTIHTWHTFPMRYAGLAILYVPFLALLKNRQLFLMRVAAILMPLGIVLNSLDMPNAPISNIKPWLNNASQAINYTRGIDPVPVQAVRPLKFVETPVDRNSSTSIKLGTAGVVLGKYLNLTLLPYPMSYYYGYAYIVPTEITEPVPIIVFIILFLLLAVALFLYRRLPVISFAILFYLISLVVFSNLLVSVPGLMGDRFLLVPSIGFAILIISLAGLLFKQDFTLPRLNFNSIAAPVKLALCVILLIYSIVTVARNTDWKDRLTLFRHDIHVVENSAQAHNLLGVNLMIASMGEKDIAGHRQMIEEAVGHFKRVLQIYPNFFNASYDLARAYTSLNRLDDAYSAYQNSLRIDTTFYLIYLDLGMINDTRGKLDSAIVMYEKFLKYDPSRREAYANLSYAYFKMKNYDQAIATNLRLIKIAPNAYEPFENIAKTYLTIGNNDSARYYFEREYQLTPNNTDLIKTLISLSNKTGDTQRAMFYQQKLSTFR